MSENWGGVQMRNSDDVGWLEYKGYLKIGL